MVVIFWVMESEEAFLTIQTAVNNIPLITTGSITVWIDSGVYLEDVMIRNLNFTSFLIRTIIISIY